MRGIFWTAHKLYVFILLFSSRKKELTCAAARCVCACVFAVTVKCIRTPRKECVRLSRTVLYSGLFSTYQRQCEIEGHHLHSVTIVKFTSEVNPPHTFSPHLCLLISHFLYSHLFIVVQSHTSITSLVYI